VTTPRTGSEQPIHFTKVISVGATVFHSLSQVKKSFKLKNIVEKIYKNVHSTDWFPGYSKHDSYNKQPNDDGLSGQDCVEIRRQFHLPPGLLPVVSSLFGTYMWNDRNCDTKNYFICERPIIDG
jgi:hypothetical protein